MKTAHIVLGIDPFMKNDPDITAYNIVKNVEKAFGIKVDYNVVTNGGNFYKVNSEDKHLEMDVAEFIESNWNI